MKSTKEDKYMALTQEEVLVGIKEIVVEVAGISADDIAMDKKFTDDLDVDSLSMVEVVVAAEERFGVKIPDEEVTNMATVGDAVNFIVKVSK
jgi:acyl carrier protein